MTLALPPRLPVSAAVRRCARDVCLSSHDLLGVIFSRPILRLVDLAHCERVCKAWKAALSTNDEPWRLVWRRLHRALRSLEDEVSTAQGGAGFRAHLQQLARAHKQHEHVANLGDFSMHIDIVWAVKGKRWPIYASSFLLDTELMYDEDDGTFELSSCCGVEDGE